MELAQFERLEEKIEAILNTYLLAKRKNEELLDIIAQKDRDITKFKQELDAISKERKTISERVDALLNKIEGLGAL